MPTYSWIYYKRTLKNNFNVSARTIRFLSLIPNDSFPCYLFLHSLRQTRLIDKNADLLKATKSNFMETALHIRIVVEYTSIDI